ncbi:hypothetical protein [uncultured Agrobacterium sp.]|uniref:hypothetical protein n=1 Tax=uncultured Agrobacterium sp. TaxID=157277 RepID=UPI00258B2C53|nr:hypothetical protein [uncultured Agrobacterium sp.]
MDEKTKHSLHSTLRENIIEHLFSGELLKRLWQRGIFDAEILKSEFDAGGYDLVLTWKNITRHIQLKVSRAGGARADVNVNLRLAQKPSGCVVWISVDDSLSIQSFAYFGGTPLQPLPDITEMKVVKHTKGNSQGVKLERNGHRLIKRSQFTAPLLSMDELLNLLLGSELSKFDL